ncbi:MAG: hypothetical protein ACREAM_05895 [Blastocatellia bacterium]
MRIEDRGSKIEDRRLRIKDRLALNDAILDLPFSTFYPLSSILSI